jgi:hypothetical protein
MIRPAKIRRPRRSALGVTAYPGNFIYTYDEEGNLIATPNPAGAYSAGSSGNAAGGSTYTGTTNPLLVSHPSGAGQDGNTQNFNPNFYATAGAAQQFAQALGGTVVIDPDSRGIDGTPMYAVRLPDGTTVNAGAIGMVLGNDAAFPGDTRKSGELANLFGAAYNPNIAAALRTGTPVRLTAGEPAPGYNVTPLSAGYQPPASGTPTSGANPPPASVTNPTGAAYRPTVALENLTSGNSSVIIAGRDHWRISISGARPNAPVTVSARRGNDAASSSPMGSTDAAGNWKLEGTSTDGDAGSWSQVWTAGSDAAGTVSLTIRTAAAGTTSSPASSSSSSSSSSSGTGTPQGTGGTASETPAGFNFSAAAASVPWYVWAIGAGVLFMGRRS